MKNIWKIVRLARPLYGLFALLSLIIFFGAIVGLIVPFFSKLLVDEIVKQTTTGAGSESNLYWYLVGSFVLSLVGIVLQGISNRLGDRMAGRLHQYLTEVFYKKILSLPQTYFDSEISGKIVNQLTRGIMVVQMFMNSASNFILPTLLQSLFTIVFMAYFSIPIAALTFALFPIYLALSYYSSKKWGEIQNEKNKIEDVTRGRIQEVIANIKLVKSFTTEQHEYTTTSTNLTEINRLYDIQSRSYHVFDFFRNLSLIIILTGVSAIAFYDAYTGRLTLGDTVLLLQLLNQARMPLFAMSFILARIQEAESGSKEYFEVVDLPVTESFAISRKRAPLLKKTDLSFNNVSFKYEESGMVLDNVSLAFGAREKVALVGHSGVGKSTIVNLLLKFYEPTTGSISLNGQTYSKLDHQTIRQNIALVFQENELFSATIAENVAYGRDDATPADVERALKLANAWDFVKKLPKGVDSQVGERGVRLSGGQKQRIQIARAILKDAPILILDEATSSLDSKSENEVQKGLDNLMKNRLTLIIAHRFSTIQSVDTVIVVDQGKVVDKGSPKELSNRAGIYRDLLQYQLAGNKKLLSQFDLHG
jgi:ATP-binding cassette subfamily B protein